MIPFCICSLHLIFKAVKPGSKVVYLLFLAINWLSSFNSNDCLMTNNPLSSLPISQLHSILGSLALPLPTLHQTLLLLRAFFGASHGCLFLVTEVTHQFHLFREASLSIPITVYHITMYYFLHSMYRRLKLFVYTPILWEQRFCLPCSLISAKY